RPRARKRLHGSIRTLQSTSSFHLQPATICLHHDRNPPSDIPKNAHHPIQSPPPVLFDHPVHTLQHLFVWPSRPRPELSTRVACERPRKIAKRSFAAAAGFAEIQQLLLTRRIRRPWSNDR